MEIWKKVLGLEEFYEVSNLGNVRSLERDGVTNYGKRKYGGNNLKSFIALSGYPSINLTKKGFRKQYLLHRLVLEAFIGKCPDGMEGCHNDGNRTNCKLDNLRWDTRSNNALDKRNHATWQAGQNNGNSKLTNLQAKEIRESKLSCKKLAKMYKVGATTISRIKNKQAYINVY
jgi:hypothetical protein